MVQMILGEAYEKPRTLRIPRDLEHPRTELLRTVR